MVFLGEPPICTYILTPIDRNRKKLTQKKSNLASLKSRQNPDQDSRMSKSNIFFRLRQAVLRVDTVDLNTCKLYPTKIGLTGNIFRSS